MSGVEQMKIPGNTAKNAEQRHIPWSQQVDEAFYENLASPSTDDNSAANQSSMQFQYPPFNAKENQNTPWSNSNKARKQPASNFDINKKYGKPGLYNNTKRDEFQQNAWGPRRLTADNPTGNYNRSNRHDDGHHTSSGKLDNRPSAIDAIEGNKTSAPPAPAAVAPKKTTWASIASQPAKLTLRTTLTTSSHKKKGPGMPPPPMVPGKHNLDVNTWDLPNNNPPPVPSPPPPIDLSYPPEVVNPDFSTSIGAEPSLGGSGRSDKQTNKAADFPKDDNRTTYNSNNSNFGRVRSSPNGHARKNWSTQHPLHQNRSMGGSGAGVGGSGSGGGATGTSVSNSGSNTGSGPMMRRNDGGPNGPNRYGERRLNYSSGRNEQEQGSLPYDYRDENSPRNTERTPSVSELSGDSQAVLDELRDKNNYNPAEIDLEKAASARFFVIKSYSEDDIHRSIKYEIWCSTDHGNKRLDDAFKERHKEGGNILLFFSVNGSGHFCGMAQMMTAVDYNSTSSVWSQDKWKGKFKVKWIYVKDVPNVKLRHIRLENNDNKSVTNSRDTQEVPNTKGIEVLQILHSFNHTTSIFDDFSHYEKKQEEEVSSKRPTAHDNMGFSQQSQLQTQSPINRHYNRQNDDRDRDRERDRENRSITGGMISGGAQKYFGSSGGGGFRDRNSSHRGNYHNFNDHRRFDGHRTQGASDYQNKDRESGDTDRESNEYGNRHIQKFDYNRRDERAISKPKINRDRDFSEEQNKSDTRFRATGSGSARDMQKDNEYSNTERVRTTTDY